MKHKKYTQELKDKIVDSYNSGVSISKLSEECGAAKATIKKWLKAAGVVEKDDKVYKAHSFMVNSKNPLYKYLESSMKCSNNLYNAANFHIRQLQTGLTSVGPLHELQLTTINAINDAIPDINIKRVKRYESELALYKVKKKEFNDSLKHFKDLPNYKGKTDAQIIKEENLHKPKKPKLNTFEKLNENNSFINYNLLDAYLNHTGNVDYYSLPAQVNQAVIKKLYNNWNSFFESIDDYKVNPTKYKGRPQIPQYKEKKSLHEVVFTNQNCKIRFNKDSKSYYLTFPKTKLTLNLGKYIDPKIKVSEVRAQKFYDCVKVEIVEDVTSSVVKQKETFNRFMALDLGVNSLCVCTTNLPVKPLIINGKPLKSINQYYNMIRADLYGQLREGFNDKEGVFTSKRLEHIDKRRHLIIKDYMHKCSNKVLDYAIEHEIDKVYIGYNKDWKEEVPFAKDDKQNFKSISFNMFVNQLVYKLERYGIVVKLVEESYTSKASAIDGDIIPSYNPGENIKYSFSGKRILRGLYRSKSGILINADVNGSCNILRKHCGFDIIFDYKYLLNPVKFTPKKGTKKESSPNKVKYKVLKEHYKNKKKYLNTVLYSV